MESDGKTRAGPVPLDPDTLSALGLGPNAPLMNDPKLLLDMRFLASLIVELDAELGSEGAARVLFQIGGTHGVRDARRVLNGHFASLGEFSGTPAGGVPTALIMQLIPLAPAEMPGLAFAGEWPEAFEASARLARLGRTDGPTCALSAGYTSGWLSEIHDLDIVVVESSCAAAGAEACRFLAAERSSWLSETDCPHDRLRPLDRRTLGGEAPAAAVTVPPLEYASTTLDPSDESVHVWGPVMVLPFTRPDDALATLDVLDREGGTTDVRAVVVDLRQHPLDPGRDTDVLAKTLETIESWGADVILTGVCALSAPLIADLAADHLLTQKDLPEAVASAFQIAEAQKHPL